MIHRTTNLPGADAEKFSVKSATEDPLEIVGLRAEIKLWNSVSFDRCPEAFLKAFAMLAEPIKSELRWYQNYTMDRFAPVSSKTLAAPATWLRSGKSDVARSLFLKGPDEMMACGKCILEFKYHPEGALYSESNTPFLRQAVEPTLMEADPQRYVDLAIALGNLLPFLSGYVGYTLVISPYFESQGQRLAYGLAVKHPGIHVSTDHATWPLHDERGVETVNWLTLVGGEPLATLGGVDKLKATLQSAPGVLVHQTGDGVVIQAGERPEIGDINRRQTLPAYRAVYLAIEAVVEPIVANFRPLSLGFRREENDEKTMRWLRRFA